MALVHQVLESQRETRRYRDAVNQLRQVLEALDGTRVTGHIQVCPMTSHTSTLMNLAGT
jgi:hypothetical protein